MTDDTPAQKIHLRKEALKRRRAIAPGARAAAAVACAAHAPPVGQGVVVAGYWPMADEMDPRPLMARLAAAHDCQLALPVVVERDRHLDFRAWMPGDDLESGEHGTWHPVALAPMVVPTVVLVPLLAFDRRGFRLGYGGGYYDRTLENLRQAAHLTTIGLAFAAQEVASVPHGEWDQRLDWIVTEGELIEVDQA